MKAIYIKDTYTEPKLIELENTLKAKQKLVGGYIEYIYWKGVALICNEEGKMLRMTATRPLRDKDGELLDIMIGPVLVVSEEGGKDLTDEEINHCLNEFSLENTSFHPLFPLNYSALKYRDSEIMS